MSSCDSFRNKQFLTAQATKNLVSKQTNLHLMFYFQGNDRKKAVIAFLYTVCLIGNRKWLKTTVDSHNEGIEIDTIIELLSAC